MRIHRIVAIVLARLLLAGAIPPLGQYARRDQHHELLALVFGAGYPVRAQQAGLRDSYARTLLDQEIGSGNPSTSAYAPIAGAPDYQGKVTISPAA